MASWAETHAGDTNNSSRVLSLTLHIASFRCEAALVRSVKWEKRIATMIRGSFQSALATCHGLKGIQRGRRGEQTCERCRSQRRNMP